MKVSYWWSEDGLAEFCDAVNITAISNTVCYHNNCNIEKGSKCYELTNLKDNEKYILCKDCFKKSIKIRN